jgi:hypothetical protein
MASEIVGASGAPIRVAGAIGNETCYQLLLHSSSLKIQIFQSAMRAASVTCRTFAVSIDPRPNGKPWSIVAAIGFGLTSATDHIVRKLILSRDLDD